MAKNGVAKIKLIFVVKNDSELDILQLVQKFD